LRLSIRGSVGDETREGGIARSSGGDEGVVKREDVASAKEVKLEKV
jgi:hypothetical protein